MKEWKNYFQQLLNAPENNTKPDLIEPATKDLPISTLSFSLEEIQKAVKDLKTRKAPGIDPSIAAEALKYGNEQLLRGVTDICNQVFKEKIAPKQFTTNLIVPVPKKGDLTQMTNYRGISLMSIIAKVYNKILLNRIRDPIESILRQNQAGFR